MGKGVLERIVFRHRWCITIRFVKRGRITNGNGAFLPVGSNELYDQVKYSGKLLTFKVQSNPINRNNNIIDPRHV